MRSKYVFDIRQMAIAKHILGFHDLRHTEFQRFQEDIKTKKNELIDAGRDEGALPRQPGLGGAANGKNYSFGVGQEIRDYAINHPAMDRFRAQIQSHYAADAAVGNMLRASLDYILQVSIRSVIETRLSRQRRMEEGTKDSLPRKPITSSKKQSPKFDIFDLSDSSENEMNMGSHHVREKTKSFPCHGRLRSRVSEGQEEEEEEEEEDEEDLYDDPYRDSPQVTSASNKITAKLAPSALLTPPQSPPDNIIVQRSVATPIDKNVHGFRDLENKYTKSHALSQPLAQEQSPTPTVRRYSAANSRAVGSPTPAASPTTTDFSATAEPQTPCQKRRYQDFARDTPMPHDSRQRESTESPNKKRRSAIIRPKVNYNPEEYYKKQIAAVKESQKATPQRSRSTVRKPVAPSRASTPFETRRDREVSVEPKRGPERPRKDYADLVGAMKRAHDEEFVERALKVFPLLRRDDLERPRMRDGRSAPPPRSRSRGRSVCR